MKIAVLVARILLGLMFVVFGSNVFTHLIPAVLPPGNAGDFMGVLFRTNYVMFIGGFQALAGLLLLVNRYVPLALTALGSIIVNILIYHILMDLKGIPLAILATVLWAVLMYRYRQNFAGVFAQKAA